jgi:hypothetical protein
MLTAETLTPEQAELILDDCKIHLIQQKNPVDLSRSGKNSVYFHCDIYNGRTSYAGCLNFLDAHMDGRAHLRPDCEIAYNKGFCPAKEMRKQELKAGHTLYFVNYEEWVILNNEKKKKDEENSPIQFRRNKVEKKFIPSTTISSGDKVEVVEKVKIAKTKQPSKKPVDIMDVELETNVMEKVLKERLKNDNTN